MSTQPGAAGRAKTRPFWRSGLFLVLFTLLGGGTDAAEENHSVSYVVSLAGINFATANVNFSDSGSKFSLDLNAAVSGVGSLVASGTASAQSEGSSRNGKLAASSFELLTKANGESFSVNVQYQGGSATGFQVDPPVINHMNRVPIERKHMRGVTDPMASFILRASELSPALCDRRLQVFTGMERYDIDMSFAAAQTATSPRTGYQGPVMLCRLKYIPVSGHFTTSEITAYLADSDKILIWYAPLNDSGYYIPYRVLMGTSAGDLSMVLTRMD